MHLARETFSIVVAVKQGWEPWETETGTLARLPALSGKTAVPETQVRSLLSESGRRGFFIISKGSKK